MMYDYQCIGCHKSCQIDFSIGNAPSSVECDCGSTLQKKISKTSKVIFKGEGFARSGLR